MKMVNSKYWIDYLTHWLDMGFLDENNFLNMLKFLQKIIGEHDKPCEEPVIVPCQCSSVNVCFYLVWEGYYRMIECKDELTVTIRHDYSGKTTPEFIGDFNKTYRTPVEYLDERYYPRATLDKVWS